MRREPWSAIATKLIPIAVNSTAATLQAEQRARHHVTDPAASASLCWAIHSEDNDPKSCPRHVLSSRIAGSEGIDEQENNRTTRKAHLVKKNTTMSVTSAIPRAFSLSLQVSGRMFSHSLTALLIAAPLVSAQCALSNLLRMAPWKTEQ